MELLIFRKKLTKTDVSKRMSIKSKSFPHFHALEDHRQHALSLMVEDEDGKEWVFRLIVRKKGYKKPVLSAGWFGFVKTKNLQVGDQVLFYKEEDASTGQVKYKIKLKKQVKLFAAVIG